MNRKSEKEKRINVGLKIKPETKEKLEKIAEKKKLLGICQLMRTILEDYADIYS